MTIQPLSTGFRGRVTAKTTTVIDTRSRMKPMIRTAVASLSSFQGVSTRFEYARSYQTVNSSPTLRFATDHFVTVWQVSTVSHEATPYLNVIIALSIGRPFQY